MECIGGLTRRGVIRRGILLSFVLLSFFTGCGSEAGGIYDSGLRKVLPPVDDVIRSDDLLNVAVHYVSYVDSTGGVVAEESRVRTMFDTASNVWSKCGVGLKVTWYETLDPRTLNEPYSPAYYTEIDRVRQKLHNPAYLLVMGTGPWVRNGSLGTSNCYSSFPGDNADGIICEKKVTSAMLMAHEVGHWFDLRHTNDPTTDSVDDTTWANVDFNLMGNIVGLTDNELTQGQCERARRAIAEWRRGTVLQD